MIWFIDCCFVWASDLISWNCWNCCLRRLCVVNLKLMVAIIFWRCLKTELYNHCCSMFDLVIVYWSLRICSALIIYTIILNLFLQELNVMTDIVDARRWWILDVPDCFCLSDSQFAYIYFHNLQIFNLYLCSLELMASVDLA